MASHDDLYARDLLKRCVDVLDERPEVVLAHCWAAMIDTSGTVTKLLDVPGGHGLRAGARAVPEHAVRRLGR